MTEPLLRLTLTDGFSAWIGGHVPPTLSELVKYLEEKTKEYRHFPQNVASYYRRVAAADSPSITCEHRAKNPRAVGARLALARAVLHNVHWWLDDRRVPDRPLPETATDDEEETGWQLSRLLIHLEKLQKVKAPSGDPISLDEADICILCALAAYQGQTRKQIDIQATADVARGTVSNRLPVLCEAGLARRKGKRGKYSITSAGLDRLKQLNQLSLDAQRILKITSNGRQILTELCSVK
jgi:hypothetical protein